MDRNDTKKLLALIQAYYPNFNPADKTVSVNAWSMVLKDYVYGDIEASLLDFVRSDTKGFPPTPGQIIDKLFVSDRLGTLSEADAWNLVSRALRDSSIHARDRFEEFPDAVQKAVGSPQMLANWGLSDLRDVETVIQSHFKRSYREVLERRSEYKKLSKSSQSRLVEKNIGMLGIE